MRKVMIFGTFDGVHEGHRAFFEQAKSHGDYLVAAVAPDDIVRSLKGHHPKKSEGERMADLEGEEHIDQVVLGDKDLGSYEIVIEHEPNVVVLGYDQEELKKDLEQHAHRFQWEIEIVTADPHEPEKYHNRLLKK
jgi:cytidyltransferase-like protein